MFTIFLFISIHRYNVFYPSNPDTELCAGSQGHPVPGGAAAGHVVQGADPVLHEPQEPGVPVEPVAVCDAAAPDDRAQRQHDQAHGVAAPDAQSHTEGDGRAAHVPRAAGRHGRVHGDADPARGGAGQRAGQAVAQPPGVLAMTAVGGGTAVTNRVPLPRDRRIVVVVIIYNDFCRIVLFVIDLCCNDTRGLRRTRIAVFEIVGGGW